MSNPQIIAAVIGGVCVLLAAAIGTRKGVSRDRRLAKARGRLRLACPHIEIETTPSGDLAVRALPVTPMGSLKFFCGFCGGAFHQADVVRMRDDWIGRFEADPHKTFEAYRKQWNSAHKARRKFELLGGGQ